MFIQKKQILIICMIFLVLTLLPLINATQTYLNESNQWQQNLSIGLYTALAWGDLDNDGDTDLIITKAGPLSNTRFSKVYINNGTTLNENSTWQSNLTDVSYGSLSLGDIDNDGDLDLALSGCNGDTSYIDACDNGAIRTKIYINNGTTFTESSQWESNLTAIKKSSEALGDIDNDGDLDLVTSGRDGSSNKITEVYLNNGTSFIESSQWESNLVNADDSSIALSDFDNDGDLDLSLTGCCDYHRIYRNNGTSFVEIMKEGEGLGSVFAGSQAFGDYDNDGDLDLIVNGRETETDFFLYNISSTIFTPISSDPESHIANVIYGSLAWIDLDNDTDLDLIETGYDTQSRAYVYLSNRSLTKNNSQSTPPNTFTSSYTNNILTVVWNNGSDVETNSTGLYYNIMVGNSTTNNTVVSGVYGGSSNPTAGYFGNMMQRKNITLNIELEADKTYYWYIQTIDTGLRKSNWSERQSFTIGSDVTKPVITSVGSSVTTSTATIAWTTDESANSSLNYGLTTALGSHSGSTSLTTSHSLSLGSLSASTLYYYDVTSCDASGNCETSSGNSLTTSATPSDGNGGNGGGGGSGGGSSSSSSSTITTTPEEKLFDVDFSTETSGSLEAKQGDIKTFSFNSQTAHKITMLEITTSSAKIIIESEPIILLLNVGEIKQIDINNDEINDFEIKLISIINNKAKFSLTKLEGADIVALEEIEEGIKKEALFDVKVGISNLFKVVKSGRDVIASIEVLNVNNIGQVDVLVDYYISDLENNTITEGSDTLAVEAVASFVRSLDVPYNAKAGRYLFNVDVSYKGVLMASGSSEFLVVKTYEIIIGVGVFVLIVITIFFYLWRIKKKTEKIEKKEARLEKLVRKFKGGKHGSHKNR